ncbi:MAG: S8 family serine peptidase [Planctomycetota bacterium]|nr:MAG: S8 family serine peptidase [Planctomycetota bacterium]
MPQKLVTLVLTACTVAILAAASPAAAAEGGQSDKTLQPQGLSRTGIYGLREIDPNLTGSGVKFAIVCRSITYIDGEPQNDYRPSIDTNCLADEQLTFHDQGTPPAGISLHSTAICSILLGEDPNAFNPHLGQFYYQGVAPEAQADVYEFWHFLTNNIFPGSPPKADVVTASIGNQFQDWWTRGFESLAERYGLIVVAGVGNGTAVHDPLLYPGAGANVIGVGVVDSVNTENLATNLAHFSLAHPEHSSIGPTADSRCKPDIVAPGNCLAADGNEPNSYEPTGNWSSFSTPIVAGTIGLLVQKAKQDPNLSSAVSPEGGNCVIKAILLNSARKLPYWHKGMLTKDDDHSAPLDNIQGAGMLSAVGAYEHLTAGPAKPSDVPAIGWDNNLLEKDVSSENIYRINITNPTDKVITATLAWNKHYDNSYPFEPTPDKDADLRLELWAVDTENPDNERLLDYSDSSTDNLEHIYCHADANYSNYEIVVLHGDADEQNEIATAERYGLAWSVSETEKSDNIFLYDLNADGIVGEPDFKILLDNLLINSGKSPQGYLFGDINTDGEIDVNDVEIILNHKDLKADWYTEDAPK